MESSAHEDQAGRIAFVQSLWHREIVDEARDAFLAEVTERGVPADEVDLFEVTGAFEIPLHAKRLAEVAATAPGRRRAGRRRRHLPPRVRRRHGVDALMRVQLDTGVPVFSAVLTPHHFHDHDEHRHFFTRHFEVKGREVAEACTETVAQLDRLPVAASGLAHGGGEALGGAGRGREVEGGLGDLELEQDRGAVLRRGRCRRGRRAGRRSER